MDPKSTPLRGSARSLMREAECKDCRREVERGERKATEVRFVYNEAAQQQVLAIGQSRSDRCKEHRQLHRQRIKGLAVAYIDLATVGAAVGADDKQKGPTGPLGGLGPLPGTHELLRGKSEHDQYGFGMDESHIGQMLQYLKNDDQRVLVVKAGTGTGKSTYMPCRLLDPPDDCFRLTDLGPIVVTEPRVQATVGVAEFVGTKLSGAGGVGAGYPVGYQAQGQVFHDSSCQLIYVTDGTVINWMRDGRLNEIGTIIVDEAHERSTNIDFIMGFLKRNLHRYPHLRVIVTSATFKADFYVEYFGGWIEEDKPGLGRSPVNKVEVDTSKQIGYGFPLFPDLDQPPPDAPESFRIKWQKACPELLLDDRDPKQFIKRNWITTQAPPLGAEDLKYPNEAPFEEDLHQTTKKLLDLRFQGPFLDLDSGAARREMPRVLAEFICRLVAGLNERSIHGDVLAFLPTTKTIKDACEIVRRAHGAVCDVYALLAGTETDMKQAALKARKKGERRKIVISSNLAETSLTVEGVRFVVDSGLICQPTWDPDLAAGAYPIVRHSRSGVKQRWGRVGRKAPGWVFPLYKKEQFLAMPEDTPPESTRSNLEDLILTAKLGGIDSVLEFDWPAAFEPTSCTLDTAAKDAQDVFRMEIGRAAAALTSMGATDRYGDPTFIGRQLTGFRDLSTAGAVAMMYADQLGCVPETATLLLLMDGKDIVGRDGPFLDERDWPLEWRVEAAGRRLALYSVAEDDAEVLLHTVGAWERSSPSEPPWASSSARTTFAQHLWLNEASLLAMAKKRRAILAKLSAGMKEEVKRFVDPALIRRARGAITRAMRQYAYERLDGAQVFRPLIGAVETTAILSPASLLSGAPDTLVALQRTEYQGQQQVSNILAYEAFAERGEDGPLADVADSMELLRAAADAARPEPDRLAVTTLLTQWPPGTRVRATFSDAAARQTPRVHETVPPCPAPLAHRPSADENEGTPADTELEHQDPGKRWPTSAVAGDDESDKPDPTGAGYLPHDIPPCQECGACRTGREQDCMELENEATEVVDDIASRGTQTADGVGQGPPEHLRFEHVQHTGGEEWFEIVGYDRYTNGGVALLRSDWRSVRDHSPGRHPDLKPGQLVDLRVGEPIRLGFNLCRVFYRTDGHGRFVLAEAHHHPDQQRSRSEVPSALDRRYQGLLASLKTGGVLCGTVLPQSEGCLTVTLLEALHQHYLYSSASSYDRQDLHWVEARVSEPPNDFGWARAELPVEDSALGLRHSFGFRVKDLNRAPAVGEALLLGLTSEYAEVDVAGFKPTDLKAALEPHTATVRVEPKPTGYGGEKLVLRSQAIVGIAAVETLLGLRDQEAWRRSVWNFFARSHLVRALTTRSVDSANDIRRVHAPVQITLATSQLAAELSLLPRHSPLKGYILDVTPLGPVVSLTNAVAAVLVDSEAARAQALGGAVLVEISWVHPRWGLVDLAVAEPVRGSARIPASTEPLIRVKHEFVASFHGVRSWIADGRLHVSASTAEQFESATEELISYLTVMCIAVRVPAGRMGRVIGRGRSNLQQLAAVEGVLHCDFDKNQDEDILLVAAADSEALERLLGQLKPQLLPATAKLQVPDADYNGRLIGKKAQTLSELKAESGCTHAWPVGDGPTWDIEGPNVDSIHRFVELAAKKVKGCQLSEVTVADHLELLDPATLEPLDTGLRLASDVTFDLAEVEVLDLGAIRQTTDDLTVCWPDRPPNSDFQRPTPRPVPVAAATAMAVAVATPGTYGLTVLTAEEGHVAVHSSAGHWQSQHLDLKATVADLAASGTPRSLLVAVVTQAGTLATCRQDDGGFPTRWHITEGVVDNPVAIEICGVESDELLITTEAGDLVHVELSPEAEITSVVPWLQRSIVASATTIHHRLERTVVVREDDSIWTTTRIQPHEWAAWRKLPQGLVDTSRLALVPYPSQAWELLQVRTDGSLHRYDIDDGGVRNHREWAPASTAVATIATATRDRRRQLAVRLADGTTVVSTSHGRGWTEFTAIPRDATNPAEYPR